MAEMTVDTYKLRRYADQTDSLRRRVVALDRRLRALYVSTGLLDLYLLNRAGELTWQGQKLPKLSAYLNQTAQSLERAEEALGRLDPLNFTPPSTHTPQAGGAADSGPKFTGADVSRFLMRSILSGVVGYGVAGSVIDLLTSQGWQAFRDGTLKGSLEGTFWETGDENAFFKVFTGSASTSFAPEDHGVYKDKSLLGDEDHWDINIKQKEIKDESKQKGADESWYEAMGTVVEAKAEAKVEGSVLHTGASGDAGWAEGSAGVKIITGEAHASAAAGLYVYTKDPKTGDPVRMFSPGVSAEVGASAAIFEADADGRIGLGKDKKGLGLYGGVDAKALSAEAKAGAALNAKEIYVEASAEADLVKVTGNAGVSLLGTDVGLTGSLKVGVGAHAQAGYTDGKLKVDVGASLGVGFDVGFEVDVSGTVDAVCDVAKSAWDGATGFISEGLNKLFG